MTYIMITVFLKRCNTFSQEIYNKFIDSIALNILRCPSCRHSGSFTVHGYYYRKLKVCGTIIRLRILRVKCSVCGCTHAILPSLIVPYSQIDYHDTKAICEHFESGSGYEDIMSENQCIDESNIAYILKNYRRHWRELIRSWKMKVSDDILQACFDHVHLQFMQIKRTINTLIRVNHIT